MVTIPPVATPVRVRYERTFFSWDHGTDVTSRVTEHRPALLTHLSNDGRVAVVVDDADGRRQTISTGQLIDEGAHL